MVLLEHIPSNLNGNLACHPKLAASRPAAHRRASTFALPPSRCALRRTSRALVGTLRTRVMSEGWRRRPDLNRGWRFCRAIPGPSRAICCFHDRARNVSCSIGSADRQLALIVCGVGGNWAASAHRGHSSGTAQREAARAARLPIPIEVLPPGPLVSLGAPAVRMPPPRQVTGTEWRQKTSSGRSPTRRTVGWTVNE